MAQWNKYVEKTISRCDALNPEDKSYCYIIFFRGFAFHFQRVQHNIILHSTAHSHTYAHPMIVQRETKYHKYCDKWSGITKCLLIVMSEFFLLHTQLRRCFTLFSFQSKYFFKFVWIFHYVCIKFRAYEKLGIFRQLTICL